MSAPPANPVKVVIAYCAECGYEEPTLKLAEALMRRFTLEIASIEIIPWYEGSFDVTVGGDLVHAMYRDGGFPEHETIINAVKEKLGKS